MINSDFEIIAHDLMKIVREISDHDYINAAFLLGVLHSTCLEKMNRFNGYEQNIRND